MSIPFLAGGSLYYAQDLEVVAVEVGTLREDKRFCIGPDVTLALWYGRRSQLNLDRGPCTPLSTFFYLPPLNQLMVAKRVEAALLRAAHKEPTHLEWFGQPLLPFRATNLIMQP